MRQTPFLQIYLDTSVLGGYYDPEFLEDTRSFFRLIREGRIRAAISDMVVGEIARAPKPVRDLLDELIDLGSEMLPLSQDAADLQEAYLKGGVLGWQRADDAMHVALASIRRVDAIASWNFKHLVDPRRAREFNGINVAKGYGLIEIRSPGDIVHILEARK